MWWCFHISLSPSSITNTKGTVHWNLSLSCLLHTLKPTCNTKQATNFRSITVQVSEQLLILYSHDFHRDNWTVSLSPCVLPFVVSSFSCHLWSPDFQVSYVCSSILTKLLLNLEGLLFFFMSDSLLKVCLSLRGKKTVQYQVIKCVPKRS